MIDAGGIAQNGQIVAACWLIGSLLCTKTQKRFGDSPDDVQPLSNATPKRVD